MATNEPLLKRKQKDGLTPFRTWVFGTGHLLNDLVGALWFNYGLYYLVNVQRVSTITAGLVFLVGQIVDAAATPLVGYWSDKWDTRIGRRKPWYIFGTVIMPVSYFFLFQDCFACEGIEDERSRLMIEAFWYCSFAGLVNIGWAAVQIAHMALIPALTPIKEKKDYLIGIRNAFTFVANIMVLVVAFILFNTMDSAYEEFRWLVVSVLSFGVLVNILFIVVINEIELCTIADSSYKELGEALLSSKNQVELSPNMKLRLMRVRNLTWIDWMKNSRIYWIGMIYMLARLSNNFTTGMIPFFLVHTIGMARDTEYVTTTPWQLAAVSLTMYLASVIASFVQAKIHWINRKVMYVIGAAFLVLGTIPLIFIDLCVQYLIFPIAILLGIGFSMCLNSSMGLISAFVGSDAKSGAFVWGMMGLLDKMSAGVVVFLVTNLGELSVGSYVRFVTCLVLFACAIVGSLSTFFIKKMVEYSEIDNKN